MKKFRIFSLLLCALALCLLPVKAYGAEGDIPVDAEHFPDPIFRQAILDEGFGQDGVLTQEELATVDGIGLAGFGISDLTGIENFTSLKELWVSGNQLTTLDLSRNTALTVLSCEENQLTSLTLSKENLEFLNCQKNQLTQLDLSGAAKLREVYCQENQLTTLDVSGCSSLQILVACDNQLEAVNLDDCTALQILNVRRNRISQLNVSGLTALQEVIVNECQLTELDVSGCSELALLNVDGNPMTTLDLTGCEKLAWLYASGLQLTELDVSGCPELITLNLNENQLTELDLAACTKLVNLEAAGNGLTTLKIGTCAQLEWLNVPGNRLTELDLSAHAVLKCVEVNVTGCTDLCRLDVGDNRLTAVDLQDCGNLEELYVHTNQIKTLDVSHMSKLKTLECYSGCLTSLTLPENSVLEWLWCQDNLLNALDVSGQPHLQTLHCSWNNIRNLDLSKNPALTELQCAGNQLAYLDVTANTNLEMLDQRDNCFSWHESVLDLSTVIPGFDVEKAANWDGGTLDGTVLTIQENDVYMHTTYDYDMGNGHIRNFTIGYAPGHEDWSKDHQCDICGAAVGEHKVGEGKHTCDYCSQTLTDCLDENGDGKCDICGENIQEDDTVVRIAGGNRYDTAIKTADALKKVRGWEKFSAIIIASGSDAADALAGSYLSTVKGAPILLSWGQGGKYASLDTNNIQYIKENLNQDGTVYILGGENAVPKLYETELAGYNVTRLGGANRFETNLLILQEAGVNPGDEILVCTAYNFADSLSASATGKPILLVYSLNGKLYGLDQSFLNALEGCGFTIIGGENAVGEDVEKVLGNYGGVTRLAGGNRFETSVLVARRYAKHASRAVLAYAWNYPDGLCGGALANAMGAPLILTMDKYEAQAVAFAKDKRIVSGAVLGGEGLISDGVVRSVFSMTEGNEIQNQ